MIEGFKPILRSNPEMKGNSETIIRDDGKRFSSNEYIYGKRKISERQRNFYENLRNNSSLIGSKQIPVFFIDGNGDKWRLDKGCISMAVHDGFLAELKNNPAGFVETVTII